jgi:superfamily II DNA or RNA helicase
MMNYQEFLHRKSQLGTFDGFEPVWMPDFLYGFQSAMVEWALRKGKGALFEDCGLGKTPQSLVWAENIVRKTNKNVLILTPLAVSYQFVEEGKKFGIECNRSTDGRPAGKITVTNYERLHLFDENDFGGAVCDESSILKHFGGSTQKHVTRFMSKMPYRLLGTATAAPNDFDELGTSSEAIGTLPYSEMLSMFFNQDDGKKFKSDEVKTMKETRTGNYFGKLAYRTTQQMRGWRLKAHAETPFWRWVCSWARACRMPSDLGFPNGDFVLPELSTREHIVIPQSAPDGKLFTMQAFGLQEERDERRRTLRERSELVAKLVDHDRQAIIWCHLNQEGDELEKVIPGCVQVAGSDSDDAKEERLRAFAKGQVRVLVTKAKIAGFGMNFQNCAHVVTYASHSYEQFYQSIRRCWRFGQKNPVTVDIVSTEGEQHVRDNMKRKAEAADRMFSALVEHMNNAQWLEATEYKTPVEVPQWLSQNTTSPTDTQSILEIASR